LDSVWDFLHWYGIGGALSRVKKYPFEDVTTNRCISPVGGQAKL
jgi:hypothetical protein